MHFNLVNENNLVEITENEMRKMKIFTTNLLKQFMGKFKHEYLLALQERHSYDRKVKCVIGLHSGHDAVIRSASVKVYQRNSDKTFILK